MDHPSFATFAGIGFLFWLAVSLLLKFLFNVGAKRVLLKNPVTGRMRNGFYGFSWTYLFFGWFVPLFRGELSTAALHLLFSFFTFGLWQFVMCFLYNRQYTGRRIDEGYRFAGSPNANAAAARALGIDLSIHQGARPA